MPRIDLDLRVDIARSPRVTQLEGLFDVPRANSATASYHFDAAIESRDWSIGLITGPSGAGKSSVARHMFPGSVVEAYDWKSGHALVDGFGSLGIREITNALSSVGFSSPPSWVKPYSVLSNGEKFRADLARAIVDDRDLVVVDEFTSLVDRTVGRIGASAVGKAVRARSGKRFVAVTCHDDVTEWLQPDWVLEPHVGRLTWRSLRRRPVVDVDIVRTSHEAWEWFAPHHYLTADLHRAARCFVGLVEERPAVFAGLLHFPHPRRRDLVSLSRLVVSPDFQGIGLGSHTFASAVGNICASVGKTLIVSSSHPALIQVWAKSPRWKMTSAPRFQSTPGKTSSRPDMAMKHAAHRRVASFMWCGGVGEVDPVVARKMWA